MNVPSKTKIAFAAAFILITPFAALATTKHHHPLPHIHHAMISNMVPHSITGACPANGGPSCSSACTLQERLHGVGPWCTTRWPGPVGPHGWDSGQAPLKSIRKRVGDLQ